MERGRRHPGPDLAPQRAARRPAPQTITPERLPKGRKPTSPGEIVQLDTLTVSPHTDRPAIKQFTAHDPVTKWTCAQAWRTRNRTQRQALPRQAPGRHALPHRSHPGRWEAPSSRPTSRPNASAAASTCSNSPPRSPSSTDTSSATTAPGDTSSTPHGTCPDDNLDHVNRWIDAFADEFNTFRTAPGPLADTPPAQYLHSLTAKETPVSHMA